MPAVPPADVRTRRRGIARRRVAGRLALAGALMLVGTAAVAMEAPSVPASGDVDVETVTIGSDDRLDLATEAIELPATLEAAYEPRAELEGPAPAPGADRADPAQPVPDAPDPADEPAADEGAPRDETEAETGDVEVAASADDAPREVWDRVATCESGQNWSIDTGNGYYGGLQFDHRSWHWAGGGEFSEYPHHATRLEQIEVAERLLEMHPAGWAAWPACSAKLGLR